MGTRINDLITDFILRDNLTEISKYDSEAWYKLEQMYLAIVEAINTQMPNGLSVQIGGPAGEVVSYSKEYIIGIYTSDFVNLTTAMLNNYSVSDDELREETDSLIESWYAHNSLARKSQTLPSQIDVDDSDLDLTPVYQSLNKYKDKLMSMPLLGYWAGPTAVNNTEAFNNDINIINNSLEYKKYTLRKYTALYENSVQVNMVYLMFNSPSQAESSTSFTQPVAKDEATQKFLKWCEVHNYQDYVDSLTA